MMLSPPDWWFRAAENFVWSYLLKRLKLSSGVGKKIIRLVEAVNITTLLCLSKEQG